MQNAGKRFSTKHQQIIFVCCFAGKRYGLIDISACLSMSVGLILFTLADSEFQPQFNSTGVYSLY